MIEYFVKCTTWWAYYSSKMGNNFCPTPSENHKRTHIHPRTHSHTLGACNAPTALVQKIMIWFFYRQIKTNRKNPVLEKILLICLNSNLPLSLVFTISLFQAEERQYPSVEKVQICKIFQELPNWTLIHLAFKKAAGVADFNCVRPFYLVTMDAF